MSWNPLKKLSRNHSIGGLSYVNHSQELDKHLEQLNEIDSVTKKLYKDAKKFCDSILNINQYESKMTDDLSNSVICQEHEELRNMVQEWHTYNRETDQIGKDFALNFRKTVIEPLKKYLKAISEMKSQVKKCEQLQHECNRLNQKVEKYQNKERTAQNLLKQDNAKKSLASAQEELQIQSSVLSREVSLFIESRINYFQPSLAALISSEAQYWGDNVKSFNEHSSMLGAHSKTTGEHSNWNQYSQRQSQRMAEINSLSIVGDQ